MRNFSASRMLDLPEPFGPMSTVSGPGRNSTSLRLRKFLMAIREIMFSLYRYSAAAEGAGQGEHDLGAADEACNADGLVGAVGAGEHGVVVRVGA